MLFDDWFKKVKANREHFIEYYVHKLGEENRNFITSQFDSLKFCFYIDPDSIEMWLSLKLEDDYRIATYYFLENVASRLNIDISVISLIFKKNLDCFSIESDDYNVKNKIKNLFRLGRIGSSFVSDDDCFRDLYCFRNLEDFINGEGKEYDNPEKTLTERRLIFLRDIGDITIEGTLNDYFNSEVCKKFIESMEFEELLKKYQDLAEIAFKYKKEVDMKYKDLSDYMKNKRLDEQKIVVKYDGLKQGINDSTKLQELEKLCKKEIASSRIICGNFDFSECINEDEALSFMLESGNAQITLCSSDGKNRKETTIFFCPFKSVPGYEDVDLRHEIRHGITSRISIDGDITTYKVGNKIEKYIDGKCVECQLSDWNEWVTQIEAKKETKDAFSSGIYIISEPSLKNSDFIGRTGDYDDYLIPFEIIYNALPVSAKKSQLESSNESLYSVIPLSQLTDIEGLILDNDSNDIEFLDTIHNISNQLSNNVVKK